MSQSLQTISIGCYHCGCTASSFYDRENGFTLVKCAGCGLLYVNPRPTDQEISQATMCGVHRGDEGELCLAEAWRPAKIPFYRRVIEDLYGPAGPSAGRWLDIGCGYGEFLLALREQTGASIQSFGSEPNTEKQSFARSKGLQVDFQDLDTHAETYDTISLLNVYSHLPNPPHMLSVWKRLLNPGGELLLQTGDSADVPAKDHHKPYMLPDHLSFASEQIVREILDRVGFDIVATRRYRLRGYPHLTPWNLAKGCARLFWPGKPSHIRVMFRPPVQPDRDLWIRARIR